MKQETGKIEKNLLQATLNLIGAGTFPNTDAGTVVKIVDALRQLEFTQEESDAKNEDEKADKQPNKVKK